MTNIEKKVWRTPKLRVLVRMKTEERVLAGCKIVTTASSGANNLNNRCLRVTCTPSFPCSTITGS